MEENNITTIQITKRTRELLAEIGKKDDTFNDIIIRLINLWKEDQQIDQIIEEKFG